MPRTIVITAAALLAAVTPAATWEAPVRLSAPSEVLDGPRLATDAAGNAVLVWAPGRQVPGQSGEVPGESWVEASYRAAGDSGWGPVARVSPPGQPAYFPVAGLLPGGRALVMWSALQATVLSRESVRDANGAWGADAPAAPSVPYAQQWAVGPDGTAAAVWVTGPAPDPVAMVAVRAPNGTWDAPVSLGTVSQGQVVVAVGPGGAVNAVLARLGERRRELVARVRGTDGTWGQDIHLADVAAPDATTLNAGAAITPTGDLVVAWADIVMRPGADWTVQAATLSGGRARQVTLGRRGIPPLHLTSGPDGVRVVWQGEDGRARIARWASVGGWRAAVAAPASLVCPGGNVAATATGPLGEDVLVFTQNGILRAVVRRPDGTWSTPRIIAAPGVGLGLPVTAAVTGGRIHVAWSRRIVGIRSAIEATSTTLADADTAAVPQDIVPVISGVRVVRRAGRPPAVVFTLSRPARVSIQLPVRPVPDVRARRGRNVVPLQLFGGVPLPRGRVPVTVSAWSGIAAGCQATRVVDLP